MYVIQKMDEVNISYFCNLPLQKGQIVSRYIDGSFRMVVPYNGSNVAGILMDTVVIIDFTKTVVPPNCTAIGGKVSVLESGLIRAEAKPKWRPYDLLTISKKGKFKKHKRSKIAYGEIYDIIDDIAIIRFDRMGL